jgi:hypothetical protein
VCALYLLVLAATRGITWPVHLWLGSIFVSGAIGVLLSYLAVPPPSVPNPQMSSNGQP